MDEILNNYIIGNNLELLQRIENESIDMIYMDQPYNTEGDFNDKYVNLEGNLMSF